MFVDKEAEVQKVRTHSEEPIMQSHLREKLTRVRGLKAIWGWSHLGLKPFGAVAIWAEAIWD